MARIFIDGFELGSYVLWDSYSGADIVAAKTGMTGSYCLDLSANTDYAIKVLPSDDEYYVAFKFMINDITGERTLVNFLNTGAIIGRLAIYNGYLRAYCGNTTTLLETGTTLLAINTTYLVQVRYKPLDSGGVFQVKIGDTLEIDFAGDTTNGATSIDSIRLGHNGASSYSDCYFDDIVVDNADWPGDTRIQAIAPNAVGTTSQFTPSAGDNYSCVDEIPYSETDYISTTGNENIDTYGAGNMSGSIDSVKCVQLSIIGKLEGSPTVNGVKPCVRVSGTNYYGDATVLNATLGDVNKIWETNPATSGAWTESVVNAMEIGLQSATI